MPLALTRPGYPRQLSLFGEPERRPYDHDAIMRERAAAIRRLVLTRPHVGRTPAIQCEPSDAQDAALYWQHIWCQVIQGSADNWCVLCQVRPCPVWDYLLEEAQRVNAP